MTAAGVVGSDEGWLGAGEESAAAAGAGAATGLATPEGSAGAEPGLAAAAVPGAGSMTAGAGGGFWTTIFGSAGRGGGGAVSGLIGLAPALGATGLTGGFLAASVKRSFSSLGSSL